LDLDLPVLLEPMQRFEQTMAEQTLANGATIALIRSATSAPTMSASSASHPSGRCPPCASTEPNGTTAEVNATIK
jgi:hypothetical protein